MKQHFLALTLLIGTSLYASDKQDNTKEKKTVEIKQVLLSTMLAFSVYDQNTDSIQKIEQQKKPKKQPRTKKQIYKPKTEKQQKYNRRKQINNKIQQYRRR